MVAISPSSMVSGPVHGCSDTSGRRKPGVSTTYGLAREIRLLTAVPWPMAGSVARAEPSLAWTAFFRSPVGSRCGRRRLSRTAVARSCHNYGYRWWVRLTCRSTCWPRCRSPTREDRSISATYARPNVVASAPAIAGSEKSLVAGSHRATSFLHRSRRTALDGPESIRTGPEPVRALKSAQDVESQATQGAKHWRGKTLSQRGRRPNGGGMPAVAPHVHERRRG